MLSHTPASATVPEDAVKLTLRLGVILDGGIKAWFKEPTVCEIPG